MQQQTLFPRVPGHFFKEPADKKQGGKSVEKLLLIPLYLVYVSHQGGRTTTNKLEAGPAAKGRDNEGQMRRSQLFSVLLRRATSPAPAQRKNYRCFPTSSRWDHKTNLVFRRSQTAEIH